MASLQSTLFWIGHASFYLKGDGYTIFIDPFKVHDGIKEKADLVLITHGHFDHCSVPDIKKVLKPGGAVIAAENCLKGDEVGNISTIKPGEKEKFHSAEIRAIPAYNVKSDRLSYHPKSNNWVGYIIALNGMNIYHAGDTDFIEDMRKLNGLEAAALPIGGKYTMDVNEAIDAFNVIKPVHAIPMHYKNLLGKEGSQKAEEELKSRLSNAMVMKEVEQPTYSF
jgi:L-ascorbate metabolism protein UlaG (beta-lactamase superfamily)